MEFEVALLSPGSPKRQRCAPLPGPTPGLRPPNAEPPPLLQTQTPPLALPQPTPPGSERQYSRHQRWRHLEVVLNQSEACTSESQPHSSAFTAPSSPVGIICERLLKDYEDKIREEYEQILNIKLAEQYESFVKFTHDQIMRRYGTSPTSYVKVS
ncbi:unnamed protein product [Nyctereutes procyonoides]|uniref:(raccoon dog) hypothetical protein n=1 Tax=Nyctereutes procyonoides TaxID=34880 RepID=A0A811ZIQ3_NYCPR|nr:unnamed protein product [Nyctereutes procyonoides]